MRWLLKSLICLSLLSAPAWAVENPQSGSAAVTVTVPDRGRPDTPVLISPGNNSTIAATAPTFIFNPSLGDRPVSHYQLWLDGVKNTDHIPQSYSTITTHALAALSEGTHTWMIKAIATNGSDRDSAIWTFTIDTTAPLILVNRVAGQETSLSSLDLSPWQKEISFSTRQRQPAIGGQGEAGALLTITWSNAAASNTVSTTIGNDRLFNLKPNLALPLGRYTVSVSSSDPAGNHTSLPSFYLDIVSAAVITISLPSPLPDLSFTVPVLIPPTLAPVTAFPLIPAAPEPLQFLVWLIVITYLCHIYCLNRFIRRLWLHHTIKTEHFILIYITILLPSLALVYLAVAARHPLPLVLAILSFICLVLEFKLTQSKDIKIEQ